ncbi:MAG: hypothetical protein E5X74_16070 [Mesorhizobium sp.]|nr:MAG: hypothetical protein EOR74_00235 [Mesorhizobium sp.]TIO77608.1 MAG: hypothetical protein E5X75_10200 [Mesorhizobium sp.]TIO84408.1 MAG: hypothetical protein E5X74_16070 [Mesorhizobium sp.]TJV51881.1 MAG: hypothetical protein E5Y01_12785 [Mesorhizobium sp.]
MVGRALKQAIVGTTLSAVLAALMGCTSLMPPKPEPAPVAAKPQAKVVRTTTAPKVVKRKKVTAQKLVKPVQTAPVIAPLGGGGGGGGGW